MARPRKVFRKSAQGESTFARVKRYGGYAKTTAQVAGTALRVASMVAGMVNAEKQYYDNNNSSSASTPNTTGNTYSISGIPQGNDEGARTGNSILMKSIYLIVKGTINSSATSSTVRMLVVEDLMNQGTTPPPADILQYNGSLFGVVSPLNVDHTTRYRVITDKLFNISINGKANFTFKKYYKTHRHVHYTGPNAGDTYKNNIYLVLVSDEATNTPTVYFNSRVGYYDN